MKMNQIAIGAVIHEAVINGKLRRLSLVDECGRFGVFAYDKRAIGSERFSALRPVRNGEQAEEGDVIVWQPHDTPHPCLREVTASITVCGWPNIYWTERPAPTVSCPNGCGHMIDPTAPTPHVHGTCRVTRIDLTRAGLIKDPYAK